MELNFAHKFNNLTSNDIKLRHCINQVMPRCWKCINYSVLLWWPFYQWLYINNINQKYGYLLNGSKNLLKSDVLADEAKRVFRDEVNITTEIHRH